MSSTINGFVLCYRKIHIFEKKGLIPGVVTAVIHTSGEKHFKSKIDAALRSASKKPTRLRKGRSVHHDLIQRNKKVPGREVMKIALDVAEGILFMKSHGVSYRDLNRNEILLDRQGIACLGDMDIISSCMSAIWVAIIKQDEILFRELHHDASLPPSSVNNRIVTISFSSNCEMKGLMMKKVKMHEIQI